MLGRGPLKTYFQEFTNYADPESCITTVILLLFARFDSVTLIRKKLVMKNGWYTNFFPISVTEKC